MQKLKKKKFYRWVFCEQGEKSFISLVFAIIWVPFCEFALIPIAYAFSFSQKVPKFKLQKL